MREYTLYHPAHGIPIDSTGHVTVTVNVRRGTQYDGNHRHDGYTLVSPVTVRWDGGSASLWMVESSRYLQPTLYATESEAVEGVERLTPCRRKLASVPH